MGSLFDSEEARLRYECYSQLQRSAVAFGEQLPVPEVVAIGGQSDGKSSLLEAFLGFRFNVRDVEMGTRRPLIVQMVHDPTALEPRCRLQQEDSADFGDIIAPETAVADAIRECTEAHLQQVGGTVSAKPIVMRAEYAFCPNLTIIDTPGFIMKARKGEADSTPDDIVDMVKAQIAPPNRLILFLQQSSVEWCSSLWMHVVADVDPTFSRTVVVASKFDNRLKEFEQAEEVNRYLSATGYLHANVQPFFVALPKERNIATSARWRDAIQDVDRATFQQLRTGIEGGFDEAKFGSRIGFGSLKGYLEDELADRYRDAAPGTLTLLQDRCEEVARELQAAEKQLSASKDVAFLRQAAMQHAFSVSRDVVEVLQGVPSPDPAHFGLSTLEERAACRTHPHWPAVSSVEVVPDNAEMRLFGGAAFERVVQEFQIAASLAAVHAVPADQATNLLLAFKARGMSEAAAATAAAEGLARSAARQLLGPLLTAACARVAVVLRQTFAVALERTASASVGEGPLRPYVAFHAALRGSYTAFVASLESQAQKHLAHHLDAAIAERTEILLLKQQQQQQTSSLNTSGGAEILQMRSLNLNPKHEAADTENEPPPAGKGGQIQRPPLRESQLTVPETPSPLPTPKGRRHAASGRPSVHYQAVCSSADVVFGAIRSAVVLQAAPATLKAAFLQPIESELSSAVAADLFAKTDADFMSFFLEEDVEALLEAKRDDLARRCSGLTKCKNEFAQLARSL